MSCYLTINLSLNLTYVDPLPPAGMSFLQDTSVEAQAIFRCVLMFGSRPLFADDPVLDISPLMRTLDFRKTQFDTDATGIPLTQSKALLRATVAAIHLADCT